MPRGVEHDQLQPHPDNPRLAIFPVMPRGVEHLLALMMFVVMRLAIFPVMPRGVEHDSTAEHAVSLADSDFSGDAARR